MNAAQTTVLASLAVVAVVAVLAPRREAKEAPVLAVAPPSISPDLRLIHGVSLSPDDLQLEDWSAWMASAPEMLRVTLAEGERDPETTVANLFRRLFPDKPWPPAQDSPLMPTWNRMVALVGRSLNRPFRPHVEIVS